MNNENKNITLNNEEKEENINIKSNVKENSFSKIDILLCIIAILTLTFFAVMSSKTDKTNIRYNKKTGYIYATVATEPDWLTGDKLNTLLEYKKDQEVNKNKLDKFKTKKRLNEDISMTQLSGENILINIEKDAEMDNKTLNNLVRDLNREFSLWIFVDKAPNIIPFLDNFKGTDDQKIQLIENIFVTKGDKIIKHESNDLVKNYMQTNFIKEIKELDDINNFLLGWAAYKEDINKDNKLKLSNAYKDADDRKLREIYQNIFMICEYPEKPITLINQEKEIKMQAGNIFL